MRFINFIVQCNVQKQLSCIVGAALLLLLSLFSINVHFLLFSRLLIGRLLSVWRALRHRLDSLRTHESHVDCFKIKTKLYRWGVRGASPALVFMRPLPPPLHPLRPPDSGEEAGSQRCERRRRIISPRRHLALALYALCLCGVLLAGAVIPSGSGAPNSPQSAPVDQAGGGGERCSRESSEGVSGGGGCGGEKGISKMPAGQAAFLEQSRRAS